MSIRELLGVESIPRQNIGEYLTQRGFVTDPKIGETLARYDNVFNIADERYLTCKVLGKLRPIIGERAEDATTYFEYIRWLDQICDNPALDTDVKFQVLYRQHLIHNGEHIDNPMKNEKRIIDLQKKSFSTSVYFKSQVDVLLATFIDDIDHQDLMPRTSREFRHYNYRVMLSISEILIHALNGKSIGATKEFMHLFAAWNQLGNLLDIVGDMEEGKLQLELNPCEYASVASASDREARKSSVSEFLTRDWFENQKRKTINGMSENLSSVWETDLEMWQKILSYVYLKYRAIPKAGRLVNLSENSIYLHAHIK